MKNQSKKTAKALAVAMFAVGFVTPVMFSNIAEAATNFGPGGTAQLLTKDQIEAGTFFAKKSSCKTEDEGVTWTHDISDANCVMINGYRFKIVKTETPSSGEYAGKQILTLWSYNSKETGATKDIGKGEYEASGDWTHGGDSWDDETIWKAYNLSTLKTIMDGLVATDSTSGKPNSGKLYDSRLTYVPYTSTGIHGEADVSNAYVWAPSRTEVESTAWGGGTALTDAQRSIARASWLRTPNGAGDPGYAYTIDESGMLMLLGVSNNRKGH